MGSLRPELHLRTIVALGSAIVALGSIVCGAPMPVHAAEEPAQYVVFSIGPDGVVQPVFATSVVVRRVESSRSTARRAVASQRLREACRQRSTCRT